MADRNRLFAGRPAVDPVGPRRPVNRSYLTNPFKNTMVESKLLKTELYNPKDVVCCWSKLDAIRRNADERLYREMQPGNIQGLKVWDNTS